MTPDQLTRKLKSMYENAPNREWTTMIHLFGILYADELNELNKSGVSMKCITKGAVSSAYGTEIRKGIRLARYVDIKKEHRENLIQLSEK